MTQFSDLGIAPKLLAILAEQKFITPTPIQAKCIPTALTGQDIIGIAQTGTGKTLAFGLPMIQRLSKMDGQGLVVLPTRELALQVDAVFQKIGARFGLRTAALIGGASMDRQVRSLRRQPHVVVATPGRLIDHLRQRTFNLNKIKIVVLDEADRMFDIGFAPQIKQILNDSPKDRQTLLFSATMPPEIAKMATQHMINPTRIEVSPAGTASVHIQQEAYIVSKECKMQLLEKHLSDNPGTVLIFSRTKHGAKKHARAITAMGHTAVEMHSDRSLAQRRDALEGFKRGKYRVLVATDIAARGIDVTDISLVINYDLPDNLDDYVHRIGRTGRAGREGRAVSYAGPDQRFELKQIEKITRKPLTILPLPVLPPRRGPVMVERSFAGHTGQNRGRGFGDRGFKSRRKWR